MNSAQSRKITGKAIALVILVAIVTAISVTLIQQLILDKSNPAVTGSVVGAVMAAMAIKMKKKST